MAVKPRGLCHAWSQSDVLTAHLQGGIPSGTADRLLCELEVSSLFAVTMGSYTATSPA